MLKQGLKAMNLQGIAACILWSTLLLAQAPDTLWTKTYGGINFDQSHYVEQTTDNGYIIAGVTLSFGAGAADVYLIKTDENGDTLWTRTYGGTSGDYGRTAQQTADNGYIIAGWTNSFGAGVADVYLIKTDENGDTLWTRTYGGAGLDQSFSVEQTADDGYIIAGTTNSFGTGGYDVYLIKTDENGDTLWTKTYGGTGADDGYSVQQTADNGYIIVGRTNSFGAGMADVYLIKADSSGDTLWTKTYGGTGQDYGYSVQQTADNGYIIAGRTNSFGAGGYDVYLIKTDENGDTLWTKTYGGTGTEYAYSVLQIMDNGYIVAGYTNSFGAGGYDVYLIKTDENGDTLWTKTYGGTGDDQSYSVQQTADNGYIVAGWTDSFGAGSYDVWLIRIASDVTGEPEIVSVADIPDDQGRWVRITWLASLLDQPGSVMPITLYGIWRRIDDDIAYSAGEERSGFVIAGLEDVLEGWDCVGTVPAIQDSIYNFTSPTLGDSNAYGIHYSVFVVTAHTQDPYLWYASAPDSGYSIDNIPPETPYNLTAEIMGSDVHLAWQIELSYPDFSHFAVYRDTAAGFTPGAANQIAISEVPAYVDSALAVGTYYYVVSAFDINGNESGYSNEVQTVITGIEEAGVGVPAVYALSQNYPNPFKIETSIYYQLPQRCVVTITVYNVSGQRTKTLINEHKDAGSYTVYWDGRDQDGKTVSNGVYFCRMKVDEYTAVKKVLLMR